MANYFSKRLPVDNGTLGPVSEQLDPEPLDDTVTLHLPDQGPVPHKSLLDEQKAIIWLRNLSEVLPVVLVHHRAFLDAMFYCS